MKFEKIVVKLLIHILTTVQQLRRDGTGKHYEFAEHQHALTEARIYLKPETASTIQAATAPALPTYKKGQRFKKDDREFILAIRLVRGGTNAATLVCLTTGVAYSHDETTVNDRDKITFEEFQKITKNHSFKCTN